MKTETPILFSTPMVQAILNGTKTQTRRIITERNSVCTSKFSELDFNDAFVDNSLAAANILYLKAARHSDNTQHRVFYKSEPGDLLWVRETFRWWEGCEDYPAGYAYKADVDECGQFPVKHANGGITCCFTWDKAPAKPSIFMPKAAARIWLQITGIRVERLQDITEADAKAEGVEWTARQGYKNYGATDDADILKYATSSFHSLWVKINGLESWNLNPWVWVIEFKVISTTGKP